MTKQALIDSLASLPAPDSTAAAAYARQRIALVRAVTRTLEQRADLIPLIGNHNQALMARNHRNHALFMSAWLAGARPEPLLDVYLWAFGAYQAHGFSPDYWRVELEAWLAALEEFLAPDEHAAIAPIYRWMLEHLPAIQTLSQRLFNDPRAGAAGGAPELADEVQLMQVIHATPLAMCITDEHGVFEYANPAYCMFYGYSPGELIGQHFTLIVPPEQQAHLRALHDRFVTDGAEIRGEWTVVDRDGDAHTILADATRITGRDGRPRKVTFIMDITERRQAERLREDVERMMRHELKAPLNAIVNIPGLLRDAPNLLPEQRELLAVLEQAGQTMLKMVDFSLSLYRIETGTYRLQSQPFNLLDLLASIIADTRQAVTGKQVRVHLLADGRPPPREARIPVWCDQLLVYSIFANLVKNAIEASPDEAVVRLELSVQDYHFTLAIHNQGAVPVEIRSRFFEKYASHGKHGGTGLGTYAARLMTETLGGYISFITSDEHGTTVQVELPRDGRG